MGSSGQIIGLLVAEGKHQLTDDDVAATLNALSHVSQRTGNELDHLQTTNMLASILSGTARRTSQDIFRSLSQQVADALVVRTAFIAECLEDDPHHFRILAYSFCGQPLEAFEGMVVPYHTTPCQYLKRQHTVLVSSGLQDQYPHQQTYAKQGLVAYIGTVLQDGEGKVIGHIALMHDRDISNRLIDSPILQTFTSRASVELERYHAETQRQRTNADLRREIAEREKAEQALKRYAERLTLLHQMNLDMLSAQSPEAIAQGVVNHLPQLVPCQRASVVTFDLEAGQGHILATYDTSPASYQTGDSISLVDHFAFMQQYEPDRCYQIEDVIALTQQYSTTSALQQAGLPSFVTAPILVQGKLVGTLNVAAERPEVYTDRYVEIVCMVVMALAAALQQAYLLEQVQDQADDLVQPSGNNIPIRGTFSASHEIRAPLSNW